MSNLHRILKKLVYLPILPLNLKLVIRGLRVIGWFKGSGAFLKSEPRILVALPYNSLGDLVLSVRFLEYLYDLKPGMQIDVVVGSKMVTLFQQLRFLNRVIGYDPSPGAPPMARYHGIFRLFDLVRKEGLIDAYDMAIDPRWDSDGHSYLARTLLYLTGAKTRVAYSGCVDGVDPSLDDFLTHKAEGGEGKHELLRKMRLLQRAKLVNEVVDEEIVSQTSRSIVSLAKTHEGAAHQALLQIGIDPTEKYAILSPAATSPRRIWPPEKVAAVVRSLHERFGLRFLVIGSPGDASLAEQLAAHQPEAMTSVAGKTDISTLAALLLRATLFIGNDSGPAHLSGILGSDTIVVSPFPLSSKEDHVTAPRRFRPCGPRVRVVQPEYPLSPCESACTKEEAHCIRQIEAAQVLAACEELLLTRPGAR